MRRKTESSAKLAKGGTKRGVTSLSTAFVAPAAVKGGTATSATMAVATPTGCDKITNSGQTMGSSGGVTPRKASVPPLPLPPLVSQPTLGVSPGGVSATSTAAAGAAAAHLILLIEMAPHLLDGFSIRPGHPRTSVGRASMFISKCLDQPEVRDPGCISRHHLEVWCEEVNAGCSTPPVEVEAAGVVGVPPPPPPSHHTQHHQQSQNIVIVQSQAAILPPPGSSPSVSPKVQQPPPPPPVVSEYIVHVKALGRGAQIVRFDGGHTELLPQGTSTTLQLFDLIYLFYDQVPLRLILGPQPRSLQDHIHQISEWAASLAHASLPPPVPEHASNSNINMMLENNPNPNPTTTIIPMQPQFFRGSSSLEQQPQFSSMSLGAAPPCDPTPVQLSSSLPQLLPSSSTTSAPHPSAVGGHVPSSSGSSTSPALRARNSIDPTSNSSSSSSRGKRVRDVVEEEERRRKTVSKRRSPSKLQERPGGPIPAVPASGSWTASETGGEGITILRGKAKDSLRRETRKNTTAATVAAANSTKLVGFTPRFTTIGGRKDTTYVGEDDEEDMVPLPSSATHERKRGGGEEQKKQRSTTPEVPNFAFKAQHTSVRDSGQSQAPGSQYGVEAMLLQLERETTAVGPRLGGPPLSVDGDDENQEGVAKSEPPRLTTSAGPPAGRVVAVPPHLARQFLPGGLMGGGGGTGGGALPNSGNPGIGSFLNSGGLNSTSTDLQRSSTAAGDAVRASKVSSGGGPKRKPLQVPPSFAESQAVYYDPEM